MLRFFQDYVSVDKETSIFKGIPIEYLSYFKECAKNDQLRYKIRYRGKRHYHLIFGERRCRNCLRVDAERFTVYPVISTRKYLDISSKCVVTERFKQEYDIDTHKVVDICEPLHAYSRVHVSRYVYEHDLIELFELPRR